ncbi:MAG: bifunctional DNA primase/polymerase [Actinomycetota bacterium]
MSESGELIEQALEALARGESVVATGVDKSPWYAWKAYQTTRATEAQVRAMAKDPRCIGFGVVTGAVSGLIILDFDGEHGIAQCEALGLNPHVRTPRGGYHVRFAHPGGKIKTLNSETSKALQARWHGLDIRADGGLAVEWGRSGVGEYQTLRDPAELEDLEQLPVELLQDLGILEANGNASRDQRRGKVEHPGRHAYLLRIGSAMAGRGEGHAAIHAELHRVNKCDCEPPKPDPYVDTLARDLFERYGTKGTEGPGAEPADDGTGTSLDDFQLEWGDPRNIRRTRWFFKGLVKLSCLNCVFASGGTGRSTVIRWMLAQATLGNLPGEFEGQPINVLYLGDEDAFRESTLPAVRAMGGDVSRLATLNYTKGRALEIVRDADTLEHHLVEHGFQLVYLDQALDHIGRDAYNSHMQQDVRAAFAPLRAVMLRLERAALYGGHLNKTRDRGLALRDLAGGSGQFVDLARSGLFLGWHPERGSREQGSYRALTRGKGNFGAVPPALVFKIESSFETNPDTGETAEVAVVADMHEDPDLAYEDVLPQAPRERGPTKEDQAEEVLYGLGADHEWRTRKEAQEASLAMGISERTFARAFAGLEKETRQAGMEVEWRLQGDPNVDR